jgi:hypothetical protein
MEPLIFLGFAVLLTVPCTALACRHRIARKQRTSYGTMFAGAAVATVITFLCAFAYAAGWDLFSRQFWIDEFTIPHKDPPGTIWIVLGFVTLICVLPALGVIVYYQARKKHDLVP